MWTHQPLPTDENIYDTDCPILYAMHLIGQKWKLPILWYVAGAPEETIRYGDLQRRVVGITPTMLTKCLRELEADGLLSRKQYPTIPTKLEYSLTQSSRALLPALSMLYDWAEEVIQRKGITSAATSGKNNSEEK